MRVILLKNPLKPFDAEPYESEHTKIIDWLTEFAPAGFGAPVKIYLNDEELEPDLWDTMPQDDDIVTVAIMPGDPSAIITAIIKALIAAAVSYVLTMLFGMPDTPDFADQKTPSPVYDIGNSSNGVRKSSEQVASG